MAEMKVRLKENNSDYFIKSLKPFRLGSFNEAMLFPYSEAERVLYLYGIEEDYSIITNNQF